VVRFILHLLPTCTLEENHMTDHADHVSEKVRKSAGKLLDAVDRAVAAVEEMKAARAALSLEAARPPLSVVRPDAQEDDHGL
jgi:hypothetical protein